MSLITIDLAKEPEAAALLADAKPGKTVYGAFTVKSVDTQTAVLRVSSLAESADELPSPDTQDAEDAADGADDEEAEGEADQSPEGKAAEPAAAPGSLGKKIAARMASGDTQAFA